jgi:predicted dinucleotide-binding enzyme
MTTIGFIGSGKIGSQIARKAIENGYDVVLSNSRGPETLTELVAELGSKARAATTPFKAYKTVPVEELAGKIVIDTNNYYHERDGHYAEIDEGGETSSGLLQKHLPTSRVVKAFNHIGAADITADSYPAGTDNRRALAISGDDAAAKTTAAALQDEFGFDTVDAGPLHESWRMQRDMPAYGARSTTPEMHARLHQATR